MPSLDLLDWGSRLATKERKIVKTLRLNCLKNSENSVRLPDSFAWTVCVGAQGCRGSNRVFDSYLEISGFTVMIFKNMNSGVLTPLQGT